MNAVDTNVLLYARDPRDARKQATAAALVESLDDAVLLWQVACEYMAATRKLGAARIQPTASVGGRPGLTGRLDYSDSKLGRLGAGE